MMDYQDWVSDIAAYRNMTPAEVDSIGRGRVWTGEQALERGLVDTLGTFDTAVEIAKKMAKIPVRNEVRFEHYPKPEGFLSALREEGFAYVIGAMLRVVDIRPRSAETWAVDWTDYR
jgi:ClpP class serine protease